MGRMISKARIQGALAALAAAISLAACELQISTYTLYRSSAGAGPQLRLHVATFDTADGDQYNRENCEVARSLFQAQPGVTVRYWCEQGRYRA